MLKLNMKLNFTTQELVKKVKKAAENRMVAVTKSTRCPEHGNLATAVRNRDGVRFSGCCEKLRRAVLANLKK